MAASPSHQFGQFIGTILEATVLPELAKFCGQYELYLDSKQPRPGIRSGKKASWVDKFGNSHDLDFIVETDGAADRQGRPLAFIECAWRRYTKHSRNKAQEIQGAVLPIAEKHAWDRPFLGAVLAGEFTQTSLTQMKSHGFEIVHIDYASMQRAFAKAGVDIAFDEGTSDAWFGTTLQRLADNPALSSQVVTNIREVGRQQFDLFFERLESRLRRFIETLTITPLYGAEIPFASVADAMSYLEAASFDAKSGVLRKIEIAVRYSNGDRLDAQFENTDSAKRFLAYVAG